eukprot:TRINITY_DN408_c0_g1_i20.p1 TRINITY_DN408_c0_g1~~TRINITY_DN408_c0_g1_i20.p1  ORF type:complete len:344 (-),score=14.13 TRINITY_DN408_c0_g1_i20:2133-3134(-)
MPPSFVIFVYLVYSCISVVDGQDENAGDNCQTPAFSQKPTTLHKDIAKIMTNKVCDQDNILCYEEGSRDRLFVDFINGSKPGQQFVICTTPKSGHTRIFEILRRIVSYQFEEELGVYDQQQYNPVKNMPLQELEKVLSDINVPKIAIVRDPYQRALSMFSHKFETANNKAAKYHKRLRASIGHKEYMDQSFNTFVELLHKHQFKEVKTLDQHFQSQTKHCRIHVGMDYDYVLKIEEIEKWYDCFVDKFNIRQEMMHGWPGEDDCFLSTQQSPCNGPHYENGTLVMQQKYLMKLDTATGSKSLFEQFYSNHTLAKMVAEVFMEDFINFNYSFYI